MKKVFILIKILLIYSSAFSQSPTFEWVASYGASSDLDDGKAIAIDNDKNVYTVGSFDGTVDFDPSIGVHNLTGTNDMFIQKLDSSGQLIWVHKIGNNLNGPLAVGNDIVVDDFGNLYITGTFKGPIDFDPSTGVHNLNGTSNVHLFILKLDSNGSFIWVKEVQGGSASSRGLSIAIDRQNNLCVAATFFGTIDIDLDPSPGASTMVSSLGGGYASLDALVLKLDNNGNFLWGKTIGSNGSLESTIYSAITVDDQNNIYTTGTFRGTVDFNPNAGITSISSSGSYKNTFIQKLDANGNFLWANSSTATESNAIAIDGQGNVCTTGKYFLASTDFNPGTGVYNIPVGPFGSHNNHIFIQKLDASGDFIWANSFLHGYNDDYGNAIAIDGQNNIYVGGVHNGWSIFILKVNSVGNLIWSEIFSSSFNSLSKINDLLVDQQKHIYTTGQFAGTIDFDPGAGTANQTSNGSLDIFILKLNDIFCTPISFLNTTDTICQNASPITLTAFPNGGILTGNGIVNDTIFDPATASLGMQTIVYTYTDGNNCSSMDSTLIYVDACLGVNTLMHNDINLYPNPTNGVLQLELKTIDIPNLKLTIHNTIGQTITTQNITNYQTQIDLSNLSSGLYFIEVIGNETRALYPITKK